LDNKVLLEIVERKILEFMDMDIYNEVLEQEIKDKDTLKEFINKR